MWAETFRGGLIFGFVGLVLALWLTGCAPPPPPPAPYLRCAWWYPDICYPK